MRAKSTLALICFLLGTAAVAPTSEAAVSPRSTQKQGRTVAAAPAPTPAQTAARPATTPRAGKRDEAPVRTAARTPAVQDRANSVRGSRVAATRPAAPPVRTANAPRPVVPAPMPAIAQAPRPTVVPVAMPVISRPAYGAGSGTPILPVAQSFGLSCVPFARMATGMDISGNGGHWWHNAAGRYARGQQPERGAVLAFPGSGGMRAGHVGVVSRVVNSRTIEIDHANWGGPGLRRGQVLRGAVVIDVSDRNDWTAVRHQVGFDSTTFGRTYPTFGFIYNRPANGREMIAQAGRFEEVADAASPHAEQHLRLSAQAFGR
jgi:surface antigen